MAPLTPNFNLRSAQNILNRTQNSGIYVVCVLVYLSILHRPNCLSAVIRALRAPERDERLTQIDERAGYSFEWAFDDSSVGLKDWLHKGEGIFWISGRPASGKSTFMKFLHNDERTSRLLRGWQSTGDHVEANFFFHYRGSAIQKSFEGLLRGILSQILEQAPRAFSIIRPILDEPYQKHVKERSLRSLRLDVKELIANNALKKSFITNEEMAQILECELPERSFRTMVLDPMQNYSDNEGEESGANDQNKNEGAKIAWEVIERTIISHRRDLLKAFKAGKLLKVLHEVCKTTGWGHKIKHHFGSLLTDWLLKTDLKARLLKLGEMSNITIDKSLALQTQDRKFLNEVEGILERHHNREKIRLSIQNGDWTLKKLEQALSKIIHQELIDMDLCIFIDALDEHDGPPEFIAQFLKDIVRQQSNRTRLKILFSSRPWNAFLEAFSDCPGFRIHEHTKNDVRELCAHAIQLSTPGSEHLLQLVNDIVERAEGVFLWVKLVLSDLSKVIATATEKGSTEALPGDLMATLESLPHDLIDYYGTIIERIPQSYRREAFCLLDTVAKGDYIQLADVPTILACLDFSKYSERDQILDELERKPREDLAILLRTFTGGLIESHNNGPLIKLQLLHQTVLEFVQRPEFKTAVLGSRAHLMDDNGHTFNAKSFLISRFTNKKNEENGSTDVLTFGVERTIKFLQHASSSEQTTGRSLYRFFARNFGKFELRFKFQPGVNIGSWSSQFIRTSMIGIAFSSCLHLFIAELLKADPSILSRTTDECLLSVIISLFQSLMTLEEARNLIDILSRNGFRFQHDRLGLTEVIFTQESWSSHGERELLLLDITRSFTDLELLIESLPEHSYSACKDPIKLIHLPNYGTTEDLLRRGANANGQTSTGRTPLDCYAVHKYFHAGDGYINQTDSSSKQLLLSYPLRYQLMVLLAQNGGRLNKCSRLQWEEIMKDFQREGLDISLFEEMSFPKWLYRPPPSPPSPSPSPSKKEGLIKRISLWKKRIKFSK